jgi:hypothetical protein
VEVLERTRQREGLWPTTEEVRTMLLALAVVLLVLAIVGGIAIHPLLFLLIILALLVFISGRRSIA